MLRQNIHLVARENVNHVSLSLPSEMHMLKTCEALQTSTPSSDKQFDIEDKRQSRELRASSTYWIVGRMLLARPIPAEQAQNNRRESGRSGAFSVRMMESRTVPLRRGERTRPLWAEQSARESSTTRLHECTSNALRASAGYSRRKKTVSEGFYTANTASQRFQQNVDERFQHRNHQRLRNGINITPMPQEHAYLSNLDCKIRLCTFPANCG